MPLDYTAAVCLVFKCANLHQSAGSTESRLQPSYVTSGISLANLKQLKGKGAVELETASSELLKK